MSIAQKIGLAFTLIIVVGYGAFVTYRDGGFEPSLPKSPSMHKATTSVEVSPQETVSRVASVSVTPPVIQSPVVVRSSAPVAIQEGVRDAMNEQRARQEIGSLTTNELLQALAQNHAEDMAKRVYFSHTDPSGITFEQRIEASGYLGGATAENLGLTSGQPLGVVSGWMNSDGHRKNLLNSTYAAVGIGVAHGTWQGMQVVFVVAVFGDKK